MMMKINRKALEGALDKVIPFVDSKPAIPVLKCILFSPQGEVLTLMSSNKSNSSLTNVPLISSDADEPFCIEGKWIYEYVKKMTGDDIEISVEGQNITLKCNSIIVVYPAMDAADFPEFPKVKGTELKIKPEELKKAIRHTSFATTDEAARPILACIHFEVAKDNGLNKLLAVSLDGCRLAMFSTPLECEGDFNVSGNVRSSSLVNILKELNGEEKCSMTFSDKMLFIDTKQTKYALEVDTGEFINFQQILQIDVKTVVKLKKREFLTTLDTLDLVKDDKPVVAVINITDKQVVEVSASGNGSIKDEIPVIEQEGAGVRVGLKNQYLLDCLKVMECDDFTISLSESTKPIIISPSRLYEYLYMVLPLKMN